MSFATSARGRLSLACLALLSAAACQSSKPTSPTASMNSISPMPQQPVAASDLVSPQPIPMDQISPGNISPGQLPAPEMTSTPSAAPLATATPSDAMSVSPAMSTSIDTGSSSLGSRYRVRPGDTLYRIAVTHYGDGKQWRKIADANPGLSPSKLRVGQSIILP